VLKLLGCHYEEGPKVDVAVNVVDRKVGKEK